MTHRAVGRHVVQWRTGAVGLTLAVLLGVWAAQLTGQPAVVVPDAPAPLSPTAQRVYEQAGSGLLQVRTLLLGQESQSSVGSGFLVSDEGHVITNYHVVSEVALEPERYRLVYNTADRETGALQLLAFDAVHDLALVKIVDAPASLATRQPLRFRPQTEPLSRGDRIYSLGKPLDVGFAVIEGTYNDLVERSFYPTLFFGGSLNPGVSGGPTLDGQGRVIGVNVAARRDGEQTSFLVPAVYAEQLLTRARDEAPLTTSAYPELTRQLLAHQETLTSAFLAQPWRVAAHPRYVVPEPQETFMRCWGNRSDANAKGMAVERTDCAMVSSVFVSGWLTTGALTVRHEAYDGRTLGTLRFAKRYSDSFANEDLEQADNQHRTAPQCHERFVEHGGLAMRAVLCLSAYKKLTGLYDLHVLAATVDAPQSAVLGRFDASGVNFDNALALAAHYLRGFSLRTRGEGSS